MKRNTGWAICLSSMVNLQEVSAMVSLTNLKYVREESDASYYVSRCVLTKEQMNNHASHLRVIMGCLKNLHGQNGFKVLMHFWKL